MKGVLEYLSEISVDQSEKLLRNLVSDQVVMQARLNDDDKIISTYFLKKEDKAKFYLQGRGQYRSQLVTFKVEIDTDVYFFKTTLGEEAQKNFIQAPIKIFRLVRRKERRYRIPEKWNHLALLLASDQMKLNTRADILEISTSGIKIFVRSDVLKLEKDHLIKVQFKIHKRAEITASGIIRHLRRNKGGGFTLGVEFVKNSNLIQGKIQNVCEDLFFYYTHSARLSHK